jgi:hypothetical protein
VSGGAVDTCVYKDGNIRYELVTSRPRCEVRLCQEFDCGLFGRSDDPAFYIERQPGVVARTPTEFMPRSSFGAILQACRALEPL